MTSKEAVDLFKQHYWKVDDKNKALEILEELVERDTPKKVCYDNLGRSECPSCDKGYLHNGSMNRNKYCGYCGQRLNWNDEDET